MSVRRELFCSSLHLVLCDSVVCMYGHRSKFQEMPEGKGMVMMKHCGMEKANGVSAVRGWGFGMVAAVFLLMGGVGHAYQEETVVKGGTITGKMKFSGENPPPKQFKVKMGSDPEFCGKFADENGMMNVHDVRVSSGKMLADVIVFLQEVERGKALPKDGPVVTVEGCQFGPRIIGAMAEQTLRVVMQDSILHQIRGWEMLDKGRLPIFHLPGLTVGNEAKVPLKPRRSSIVKLECDQHRFMQGWVLLTANPYVTVTDEQGAFRLTEVPAGTHTVGAWHPALGYQEAKVTLAAGKEQSVELTFSPPPHP